MPNRRDMVAMDEQEMWQFIESQRNIQVCTINKDGTPHLTTMWFTVEDEKIVLVSFTKSQKVVNLKRNPNIAVLLESGQEYHELQGVSINCVTELIDDPETVQSMETALILRNLASSTPEQAKERTDKTSKKKTAIVVRPEKVMSWDHSKLDVNY